MYVIVDAGWSAALYCQRCGKLHIHDVAYFSGKSDEVPLKCSCGHHQATLVRSASNYFKLEIPCVVCSFAHEAMYKSKQLLKMKVEKIYCAKDHFELGYVGKRQSIEEILAFDQHAFESLDAANNEDQIEKQRILLDVLNRIHDIAERGGIQCPCGAKEIAADILGSSVILECCHCGGYSILPAKSERDLGRLNETDQIHLTQRRFFVKNIDLD